MTDERSETGDERREKDSCCLDGGRRSPSAVVRITRHENSPGGRVPPQGAKRDQGFALLITLTLLAFIVVMLIGLAMYARIETAVAGNTQRQAQARENALLGLNIALSQLQKHAGPDTRVTATAANFGGVDGTRHYTGVWSSAAASSAGTPLTWLVSGNEKPLPDIPDPNPDAPEGSMVPAPLAITPAAPGSRLQNLAGPVTTGDRTRSNNWVDVPLLDISATGIPGATAGASTTIGRYAWWVGDQGVKAPVAVPDTMAAINFAPFGDGTQQLDLGARVRQQLPIGAGATNAADGVPVFEPADSNNTNLVADHKVTVPNQLAFLRTENNALVGLRTLQQNFHVWSPNNFAVLANTKEGGLRVDLSVRTNALGSAYGAWSNYEAPQAIDMEALAGSGIGTPLPMPPYDEVNPIRRRYFNTPAVTGGGLEIGVHPVLAFFGISFSIRDAVSPNYEVSARCVIGLWNPYTAALVPPAAEDQRLEIHVENLPDVTVRDSEGGEERISLQQIMGQPLKFVLSWPTEPTQPDEASWLPGRVYYWTAESNTTEPEGGNVMKFNERSAAFEGQGLVRPAGISHRTPPLGQKVYRQCVVANDNNTTLLVRLVRPSAVRPIQVTFESVKFADFETSANAIETNDKFIDFAYIFRLPDSRELPENQSDFWLAGKGRDPRMEFLSGSTFVSGPEGPNPDKYGGRVTSFATSYPDRLLDRSTGSHQYNEDVPVFELPRAPVLSVGFLQHLPIPTARPFAIGNPWGSEVEVGGMRANQLFDRFFFSGLIGGVSGGTTASGEMILPNPLLKLMRRSDGAKLTIDDVRGLSNSGYSSKFFLQGAAFNLNSVNAAAWAAVLRGVRFPNDASAFRYLDASFDTGGTADTSTVAEPASGEARFFRFPQSAQETYKADLPNGGSTYGASTAGAPSAPDPTSQANTHLFRRGMRTLSGAQVAALAAKIVELIGVKHVAADLLGGPFRSLEEFLAPSTLFSPAPSIPSDDPAPAVPADSPVTPLPTTPRSLLEAAIADAGINADIPEFSSQFLTQGDIMTSLAPVLFPRSDTFLIRSYGEAINPTKLPLTYRPGDPIPAEAIEGKAWAEAIVQRLPEYLDPSMPPESQGAAFEPISNPDDPDALPTLTQAQQVNQLFGRRFKIVSFRWLTRSDI